ncbi:MAG: 16S rRNA (cytosine(1402)-N(4))-methyltransferase RsmH [Bacillota bacterium]|nr:16S rRNA (cytosine(1402)-N(4))-methyltransferase RsmH [Bacillota bacterium]
MDQPEKSHQRRVRYTGTHPKSFEEKYKERQPEKYADTIAKVIQKGNTPAGTHRPILVNEILEILRIQPGQTGLDATLGYGGHATEILKRLDHTGHLFAIDADPLELPRTQERLANLGFGPELLSIRNINFSEIEQLIPASGKLQFVLADLGVSSMQLDNPERGFSFKAEGPLDLRMNPEIGLPASYRLKMMTEEEIEGMLVDNADEPHASQIASAIVAENHKGKGIATTTQFQKVIKDALRSLPSSDRDEEIKKSCQRTFQALRIDVNHEYESLYAFLEKLPDVLASGGRVAILSFHSGEDRLVKKSFQALFRNGTYREIAPEFIRPSMEEQSANSRAASAKLRWAERA